MSLNSSKMVIRCVWLLLLIFLNNNAQAAQVLQAQPKTFDVNQHGGAAGGKTDNSKAFIDAWNEACKNEGGGVVLFPKGTYLVNPLMVEGRSCKGPMEVRIQGTLLASKDTQHSVGIDHWILFRYVSNLTVTGGGTLDGQGASAWHNNDCIKNKQCKALPGSLKFDFANNTKIDHINSINSKNTHINCFACHNVKFSNINIKAPGDSPNTDGIKIGESSNIEIIDSVIGTGDDCLAFLPDSSNISVTRVHCGPGHGFSLGSISSKSITNLIVTNSSFAGTQNGVRIKTKSPSQTGSVKNVTFQHIQMDKVDNPIVIDQQYCPGSGCVSQKTSEIQISEVKYIDIWGTSNTESAVTFRCSENKPCTKIELRDINLTFNGGKPANETCLNAKGVAYGKENPKSCLQ